MHGTAPAHASFLGAFFFLIILIGIVLAGGAWYLHLRHSMLASGVEDAPLVRALLVLAAYGGWLVVLIITRLWQASDTLGDALLLLLLAVPWVMLGVALRTFRARARSRYHAVVFGAAAGYVLVDSVVVYMMWTAPMT